MASPYFDPGAKRADKVGDLFAAIAPRYDAINDWQSFGLHRLWKRRMIERARVQPGDRALDLCCGTGDVAFALAERGARVVGLDFSEAMLAVAQARASRWAGGEATNKPHFLRGDSLAIPFGDAQFDVVTVSYGLRNLASCEQGLREMHRVAKPGGRLLVLDFGKPPNAVLRALYFAYLRRVVPIIGKIFCGDAPAYAYIYDSLQAYPGQEGVASLMRQLGCANAKVENLLGGVMALNYGERATGEKP